MVHFRKFGLLDLANVCNRVDNNEWMRFDHTIISWFYNTVSKDIHDMILCTSDMLYG
jgi:hypothetical protein